MSTSPGWSCCYAFFYRHELLNISQVSSEKRLTLISWSFLIIFMFFCTTNTADNKKYIIKFNLS